MTKTTILEMADRAFPDLPQLQTLIADVYEIAYQQALDDAAFKIAAMTPLGDTAASFAVFVRNLRKPSGDA
jgi:hypothetical protein